MGRILRTEGLPKEYKPVAVVLGLITSAMFLVQIGRLYQLQVLRHEDLNERSRNNFVREQILPADRGMVLDRKGRILVDNRPSFDVHITPAFATQFNAELERLAALMELSRDDMARVRAEFRKGKKNAPYAPILVRRDVPRDMLDLLEAARAELDGVDVIIAPQRNFRHGTLLAHQLGYVGEVSPEELKRLPGYRLGDLIGKRGLEKRWEEQLKGADGLERLVVDARGRRRSDAEADALIGEDRRLIPSAPGKNLVLSVDLRLQELAEKAFTGPAGAIVALDPQTGFVLAMVSRPAFDPNKLSGRITREEMKELTEDRLEPLINRPMQQHYHPGSTFKVVTGLAALEAGVVATDSILGCPGFFKLGNHTWRCWRETGHGQVSFHRSLVVSCDTFYYTMGDRLGLDAIAERAREFGFGSLTGLEVGTAEVPGVVPTVDYYNRYEEGGYTRGFAINVSIGQGALNVTPLQLALAYAALGNGGTLYKPQIVRRVEDAEGRVLQEFGPAVVRTLSVKPQHLQAVVKGLMGVVNEGWGTAYHSRLEDAVMAGKTGTAQVVALGENRKEEELDWWLRDHAWFVAFAPADAPEIVVAVINEHAGHGGSAAAPIARAVVKGYFDLKREEEASRTRSPAPGAPARAPSRPPAPAREAAPPAPLPGAIEPRTARVYDAVETEGHR
jgi:penicillin-binding protein 2